MGEIFVAMPNGNMVVRVYGFEEDVWDLAERYPQNVYFFAYFQPYFVRADEWKSVNA